MAFGAMAESARFEGQNRGGYRHWCERRPNRAGTGQGSPAAQGFSAIRALDIPQSAVSRGGQRRQKMAADAYAVLRALVSLPAVLCQLRRVAAGFEDRPRSISLLNDRIRQNLVANIKHQIGDDNPELLEKAIPKYPPFGNRILADNGAWLSTMKRDNVDLITDGIREIVKDGIIDGNGNHHAVDVIVYATGFYTNRFLSPMEIIGKGGTNLRDSWGDEAHAYLGITVPKFPNLFLLYGPSTNLAHGGSIIFHSECQVIYVMGCIKALIESGASAMECKEEPFRRYVDEYTKLCAGMVWAHPGTRNWYKNSRGVVVNTSPWRLVDYWKWTREPNLADYELG
jgi:4-hydroxyacetophenone monooxygenase